MNSLSEPYKARMAVVEFGNGITCDAYELPTLEVRYGLAGASLLFKHDKSWLSQVVKRTPKQLKTLQINGFTGCIVPVQVSRASKSGASFAQTISGDDLDILVQHEAARGNFQAIALIMASFSEVRASRERAEERTSPADSQGKNGSF